MIRPAVPADLPRLTEIERAADALFPVGRIPIEGDTYPPEALARVLEVGQVLVVEAAAAVDPRSSDDPLPDRASGSGSGSGDVIGFSVAQPRDDVLHLDLIAVHPGHGRRGLGKQLLEAVIAEAHRRALAGVTLTTFSDLKWNAPFYAQHGFRTLSAIDLSPRLRAVLQQEAALGMERRVAMFRPSAT